MIGGGFISCEVTAAVATHCPGMQLVMVMPGDDVMSSSGFGKEVCHFYEKQLARVSARSLRLEVKTKKLLLPCCWFRSPCSNLRFSPFSPGIYY